MITRIDKERKLNDMSPEEKAKELVDKFQKEIPDYLYRGKILSITAKACAIICCDEIAKYVPYTHRDPEGSLENIRAYETSFVTYWDAVKTEIQKL